MPADRRWLSAHLYLDGGLYAEPADRAILEIVAPVAIECLRRRWARRCFFLRYTDGSPHIRFRLFGRPDDLDERVRPLLAARVAAGPARELAWVGYEPELDRYGGPAGVAVAERFFHASSRLAFDSLASLPPGDRSARLGRALLAMLALLHVFVGDRAAAARAMLQYGDGYLRQLTSDADQHRRLFQAFEHGLGYQADALGAYVEAAWRALEGGDGLPAALAVYRRRLAATARRLRAAFERRQLLAPFGEPMRNWPLALSSIFPSYLHMTSNRLGVTIREEAYLAVVAHGTLIGGRIGTRTGAARPVGAFRGTG